MEIPNAKYRAREGEVGEGSNGPHGKQRTLGSDPQTEQLQQIHE